MKTSGTGEGRNNPHEFTCWRAMHGRCSNPRNKSYRLYGGRGVRVCERWHDFRLFLDDMGPRPTLAHSIDRIDSNGNYEPGNCRWATPKEQSRNCRSNRMLTHGGETKTLSAWAEEHGLGVGTLAHRLRSSDMDRALLPVSEYSGRSAAKKENKRQAPAGSSRVAWETEARNTFARLREMCGTRTDVAIRLGCSDDSVARWESGRTSVPGWALVAIRELLQARRAA